jgi:hypothetical protein
MLIGIDAHTVVESLGGGNIGFRKILLIVILLKNVLRGRVAIFSKLRTSIYNVKFHHVKPTTQFLAKN